MLPFGGSQVFGIFEQRKIVVDQFTGNVVCHAFKDLLYVITVLNAVFGPLNAGSRQIRCPLNHHFNGGNAVAPLKPVGKKRDMFLNDVTAFFHSGQTLGLAALDHFAQIINRIDIDVIELSNFFFHIPGNR